ncbi:unnamed protein product [Agarophyton chilense]|eukprot:gb/GEZJ01001797.1/.p1 GENE.gb/GEZJ01001797.1/~~gb/GEZJ01001797.1/.p1  ORF type:complete len:768 (-),score=138.93 gb/GEZJ01001797.1/:722-3025(-)
MRKQRTLTAFFRPLSAQSSSSSSSAAPRKAPRKRPRAQPPSPPAPRKRPRTPTSAAHSPAPPHHPDPKPHPVESPQRDESPQRNESPMRDESPKPSKSPQCHESPKRAESPTPAEKLKPERAAAGAHGKPVPYATLAHAFTNVEAITGRLHIQAVLCSLFRDIIATCPDDLVRTIYLCINRLAPAHHGIELGVGDGILLKSLSLVTGRSLSALKATYKKLGDLGDVAFHSRTTQKTMFPPPPLTVQKVFSELQCIASVSGKNAQQQKQAIILKMLVAASKTEAKYLARALSGKLRIHLADKTVIAALAAAVVLHHENVSDHFLLHTDGTKKTRLSEREQHVEQMVKDATAVLNAVYSRLPVWDIIIPNMLQFGAIDERLSDACQLLPGVPVSPMLAKPTKAISQVLERFAEVSFTCEYKYDGERAQIHRLTDGSMKIYSRNAENLTPKYPDLVRHLPTALRDKYKKSSFIIDAEAVAYDVQRKKILPFQELQSRKRKDVNAEDIKVKVCIFAFDLLYFDGNSLIEQPLNKRRSVLLDAFEQREGRFMFAKGQDSQDPEQIMELLNSSVKEGCEGLMVKALDGANSTYEPANRSQNWLKVKKDYLDGCGDSLDLVPIGGYRGRGKRSGAYGAFLLACYDGDNEEYQSVCKIGTGFSEVQLEEFGKFFNDEQQNRISEKEKSYYRTPSVSSLKPDVWFEPVQVWEVKCADLSISPQHTAGIGRVAGDKGVALRFPRFVRVREDKAPEQATTAEQVVDMYLNQSAVADDG